MILNAVGRLSSLNRWATTDGPIGANGRSDCFNTGDSCSATIAVDLELCGTADSRGLLPLPTTSARGVDKIVSGSLELEVAAFVESATIPSFCLLATFSGSISPFIPVACRREMN